MEKQLYILLIGPQASGKSTMIEKIISQNVGAVVLSTDNIITQLGDERGLTYTEMFELPDTYKEAEKIFNQNREDAFKNHQMILHDQTNLMSKARKGKISKIDRNRYTVIGVTFDVPWEILCERHDKRRDETGKNIPYNVRKNMYDSYQAPTLDEGFDMIVSSEVFLKVFEEIQ